MPTVYVGYKPEVGGIGDFYYILFQIFCYCRDHNIQTKLCIPNHPLNLCMIASEKNEPDDIVKKTVITTKNIDPFLTNEIEKMSRGELQNDLLIYTNMNDFLHLYVKYMNPIKRQVLLREFCAAGFLTFTHAVEKCISNYTSIFQGEDYIAIHVRCGDSSFRSTKNATQDLRIANDGTEYATNIDFRMQLAVCFLRTEYPNTPICIFSDNEELKQVYSQLYELVYFPTKIIHIADTENDTQYYIDSFCEFVMLGRAKAIFAFSVSNFSRISGFLFETPVYTFRYSPQSALVKELSGDTISSTCSSANNIILSFGL